MEEDNQSRFNSMIQKLSDPEDGKEPNSVKVIEKPLSAYSTDEIAGELKRRRKHILTVTQQKLEAELEQIKIELEQITKLGG